MHLPGALYKFISHSSVIRLMHQIPGWKDFLARGAPSLCNLNYNNGLMFQNKRICTNSLSKKHFTVWILNEVCFALLWLYSAVWWCCAASPDQSVHAEMALFDLFWWDLGWLCKDTFLLFSIAYFQKPIEISGVQCAIHAYFCTYSLHTFD